VTADWQAEAQAGVDRWLETQRAWWTTVLGDAPSGAAATDAAKHSAVEAWRQAARDVVDAQADVLRGMLSQPPGDTEQMLRRWTDAQRELLQGWLAVAGGGAAPNQPLQDAGRQMVESLRQAAEQLVSSQAQWAEAWTRAQADQAGRPPEPGGKPGAAP